VRLLSQADPFAAEDLPAGEVARPYKKH
jgi:hypothetical protein